ncbi:MAG: ACT domain-containing protein [Pseudomonadota bacterium]
MPAEANLTRLIESMQPVLADGEFVFATSNDPVDLGGIRPQMQFHEAEGVTYILRMEDAKRLGLRYEFPCKMISLNVHSALDAVGFLAAITKALAAKGMGVNPVSGFFHDHLFVPEGREEDAMSTLHALSQAQKQS